ncbi:hypothetical protein B0O80DRAFT_516793 [Mortierella sp. GBAus27b]|nr:hypothetical protein B0O80DRAFT_516793 [Mortierella sp. GBAus27b]
MDTLAASPSLERALAIVEIWENVVSFLFPAQIRRLRLVSKRLYLACIPQVSLTLPLGTTTEPHFHLITSLRLNAIDQISPLLIKLFKNCPRITSLEINDFGLDIDFLKETLESCPTGLRRLAVRSDGFVDLQSIVDTLLDSNVTSHIQELGLDVGDTGLEETHSLSWSSFRSILDTFSSLRDLSLGSIKVTDVPESLEKIDPLHATTMTFPSISCLSLRQCIISGVDRVRLLRLFTNLERLKMVCRETVFDHPLTMTMDQQLCTFLRHISVGCTNSRSLADQGPFYQFLSQLPNLEALELSGFGASNQELVEMAEEWTRHGVKLRHLRLNLNQRKTDEDGLEKILRLECCSRLESLDAWFGPDLVLKFWNAASGKSDLPFLKTLKTLCIRKVEQARDLQEGALQALNLTLRQMPRLVDLVIGTKLDDLAVMENMGRDPELPPATPGTFPLVVDWSHERPFLQTLSIGISNDMPHDRITLQRQLRRRFRFLEELPSIFP